MNGQIGACCTVVRLKTEPRRAASNDLIIPRILCIIYNVSYSVTDYVLERTCFSYKIFFTTGERINKYSFNLFSINFRYYAAGLMTTS